MRKRLSALLILAAGLAATPARAGGDALLGAEGNERCGVGSMIFGGNRHISSQTFEVSTNFYFSESLSVTVGTSGCRSSGLVQVPEQELFYANANFEELMLEMASGKGETLAGFGQTMGCGDAEMPLFMSVAKQKYSQIYPSAGLTPYEMLTNFRKQLRNEKILVRGCRALTT